ncbi:hypothetical protein [Bradyrhizobium japonicum]|jgi:hypothetical protein|uniref:hypothetical protein n=1 Tax=Bradyrhizobium japonicum TaxID=375 RepID=UPI0012BCE99F|nr:hypothetical protein [Bradyrhizobium japonicum]
MTSKPPSTPQLESRAEKKVITAHKEALKGTAATIIYTMGPKGGVGKSLTGRLIVDVIAAQRDVRIAQIDRAPTLPQLYPDKTITIEAPGAEEMRSDLLASMRVFEPLEEMVQSIAKSETIGVIDVGAGQNQRAFLNFVARARFDRFLVDQGIRPIVLVLMTADPSAISQSANLMEELQLVHPDAEIVPVFNLRDGGFKFLAGTPAHKIYNDKIVPLLKDRRRVTLPAIAAGAWPLFESAGMTFTEAVMADEATLIAKLGMSRLMVTALQGYVSEFVSVVWPRLGAIAGFSVGAFDAGR